MDGTAEIDIHPAESPFWREGQQMSELDRKAMIGTRSMTRLVQFRSKINIIPDFEEYARDFYEEIFTPFGHGVRDYRETNTRVLGGRLKYPEHFLVPKRMREFAQDLSQSLAEVEANPSMDDIISLAAKAHRLVYIHPFADGNGRVSRAMANYVLLRFGYPIPNWRFEGREKYLDAVADGWENPKAFEKFLTGTLVDAYRQREGISRLVTPYVDTKELFGAIRQQLEEHLAGFK